MKFRPSPNRLSLFVSICASALVGAADPSHGQAVSRNPPVAKRPLTVAAAIQTTRLMSPPPTWIESKERTLTPVGRGDVSVSPNGKRYAAILVRGDLARNGNWLELITGRLDSLDSAGRVERAARFFTSSLGTPYDAGSSNLTLSHFNPIAWLPDNERVAFYFSGGKSPIQVVMVNVRTHRIEPLTKSSTDVVSFSVSRKGTVVYAARAPRASGKAAELLRKGFVVPDTNAVSLLRGDVDGFSGLDSETFVTAGAGKPARRIRSNARGVDRWVPHFETRFSPDGRYALIDASPDEIPDDWGRYTDELFKTSVQEARHDRNGFYARFLKGLFVVDLERATSRPLWRVPNATRVKGAWSPDGRSVLLGPTYVPADRADSDGLAGRAVAEVDVATGDVLRIPLPSDVASRGVAGVAWLDKTIVEVEGGAQKLRFQKTDGKWQPLARSDRPDERKPSPSVRVELHQDANTPPRLFAVEAATGRERMILDLNPGLQSEFTLGRVEAFPWTDKEGHTWSGLLYYPADYVPDRRFPLVIQTHGHAPATVFSLYGPGPGSLALGLGPSYSVFAAQPLANRNIAVLQIEDKDDVPGAFVSPKEAELHMGGYESAIEKLVGSGLVDREKVGIVGYSRTGWHVEYALTHSAFPFAAAITSDNMDGSYVQSILFWTDEFEKNLGAPPFGEGLKTWLERAPGFNADKVRTPLRLQLESGGLALVMAKWEMFSRLRQLKKPVEFIVVPDVEHGSHGLQNPAQCLASQQGAVDWFDFWLNGRQDPDPKKTDQYARWRKLRELHEADLASSGHPTEAVR